MHHRWLSILFLALLPLSAFGQKLVSVPGKKIGKVHELIVDRVSAIEKTGVTKANARGLANRSALTVNGRDLSTRRAMVTPNAEIHSYIYVKSAPTDAMVSYLKDLGVRIETKNDDFQIVSGWIPFEKVDSVAALDFVESISPPLYGRPRIGSETTQGDAILNASALRAYGFDGTGVKVGIISDGAEAAASAAATGDLPATVTTYGTCTPSESITCDEGTAMAEIIHDLAPGAELAVGSGLSVLTFVDRIEDLINDFGAEIIVDDIGFFVEPFFEDGYVAQNVAQAVNTVGTIYASAAGNDGDVHYEEAFEDGGSCPAPGFSSQDAHDFGVAGGDSTDLTLSISLANNDELDVYLQWNDDWGTSANNYDLYILNNAEDTILASGTTDQTGSGAESNDDLPIEFPGSVYQNTSGSTQTVNIAVCKDSGATDRQVKMMILTSGTISDSSYLTPVGSIVGHPAVSGALAVAAVRASDPGNDDVEVFSSQGPTQIYYPSSETREKPDLAAINGVSVTGVGGFSANLSFGLFFGTSAAAPHVAGVAALLKEVYGGANAAIISALKTTTIDIESAGFDYLSGYGLVNALAAAQSLNDAPESTIDTPAAAASINGGETVSFAGSCTDSNTTEGMTFAWNFGESSGVDSSVSEDPGEVTFNTAGTYTVSFTCTDSFGTADSTPATVEITVTGNASTAPTVTTKSGCTMASSNQYHFSIDLLFLLAGLILLFLLRSRASDNKNPRCLE